MGSSALPVLAVVSYPYTNPCAKAVYRIRIFLQSLRVLVDKFTPDIEMPQRDLSQNALSDGSTRIHRHHDVGL